MSVSDGRTDTTVLPSGTDLHWGDLNSNVLEHNAEDCSTYKCEGNHVAERIANPLFSSLKATDFQELIPKNVLVGGELNRR